MGLFSKRNGSCGSNGCGTGNSYQNERHLNREERQERREERRYGHNGGNCNPYEGTMLPHRQGYCSSSPIQSCGQGQDLTKVNSPFSTELLMKNGNIKLNTDGTIDFSAQAFKTDETITFSHISKGQIYSAPLDSQITKGFNSPMNRALNGDYKLESKVSNQDGALKRNVYLKVGANVERFVIYVDNKPYVINRSEIEKYAGANKPLEVPPPKPDVARPSNPITPPAGTLESPKKDGKSPDASKAEDKPVPLPDKEREPKKPSIWERVKDRYLAGREKVTQVGSEEEATNVAKSHANIPANIRADEFTVAATKGQIDYYVTGDKTVIAHNKESGALSAYQPDASGKYKFSYPSNAADAESLKSHIKSHPAAKVEATADFSGVPEVFPRVPKAPTLSEPDPVPTVPAAPEASKTDPMPSVPTAPTLSEPDPVPTVPAAPEASKTDPMPSVPTAPTMKLNQVGSADVATDLFDSVESHKNVEGIDYYATNDNTVLAYNKSQGSIGVYKLDSTTKTFTQQDDYKIADGNLNGIFASYGNLRGANVVPSVPTAPTPDAPDTVATVPAADLPKVPVAPEPAKSTTVPSAPVVTSNKEVINEFIEKLGEKELKAGFYQDAKINAERGPNGNLDPVGRSVYVAGKETFIFAKSLGSGANLKGGYLAINDFSGDRISSVGKRGPAMLTAYRLATKDGEVTFGKWDKLQEGKQYFTVEGGVPMTKSMVRSDGSVLFANADETKQLIIYPKVSADNMNVLTWESKNPNEKNNAKPAVPKAPTISADSKTVPAVEKGNAVPKAPSVSESVNPGTNLTTLKELIKNNEIPSDTKLAFHQDNRIKLGDAELAGLAITRDGKDAYIFPKSLGNGTNAKSGYLIIDRADNGLRNKLILDACQRATADGNIAFNTWCDAPEGTSFFKHSFGIFTDLNVPMTRSMVNGAGSVVYSNEDGSKQVSFYIDPLKSGEPRWMEKQIK